MGNHSSEEAVISRFRQQLSRERELEPALDLLLKTAMDVLGADKGNIQLYDKTTQTLKITAHSGFDKSFLEYFKNVRATYCCCGMALKRRERVMINDVNQDPEFSHFAETFNAYGYTGVQSTPLKNKQGEVFGMLSTHFVSAFYPKPKDLGLLDRVVTEAEPLIEQLLPAVPVPDENIA